MQSIPAATAAYPPQGIIAAYMEWASRTTHAPLWFHLGSILPVVGYEAARRGFAIEPGKRIFRLLVGLVGPSGGGKSTATSRARMFSALFWDALQRERPHPYVSLFGSVPGVVESISKLKIDALGITPSILEIDEYSAALAHNDFADVVNVLFDGRDFERNLRRLQEEAKNGGRPPTVIQQPRLFGIFTSTVASLERVVHQQHLEGGLFSRILWLYDAPTQLDFEGDEDLHFDLRDAVKDYWVRWSSHIEAQAFVHGRRIVLLPEASNTIRALLWPIAQNKALVDETLGGYYLRLVEYSRIVAALYAFSRGELAATAEDAATAVAFILKAASSIEQLALRLGTSEPFRVTQRLFDVLRSHPEGLSRRDLCRRLRVPANLLDQAIATLHDDIELVTVRTRGRPTTRVRLAPLVEQDAA